MSPEVIPFVPLWPSKKEAAPQTADATATADSLLFYYRMYTSTGVAIRVMPKRSGEGSHSSRPSRAGSCRGDDDAASEAGSLSGMSRISTKEASLLRVEDKLDMSLDDLIGAAGDPASSSRASGSTAGAERGDPASSSGTSASSAQPERGAPARGEKSERAQGLQHKLEQMGWTPETNALRRPPLTATPQEGSLQQRPRPVSEGLPASAPGGQLPLRSLQQRPRPVSEGPSSAPGQLPFRRMPRPRSRRGARSVSPARAGGACAAMQVDCDAPAEPAQCTPVRQVPAPPPGPPGLSWVQFEDGEVKWWYYNGPEGEWYTSSIGAEVRPYDEVVISIS